MISIIICSANSALLDTVKKNIADSIGVPFEVIAIDNSKNEFGICRAYNRGAAKAKFPVLCFMHEDIFIETKNWGNLVCKHLNYDNAGLIGVAGGDAKSMVPSSWSIPMISNEINVYQHYKAGLQTSKLVMETSGDIVGTKKKVVALDGMWLCTKKEIFDQFKFDEITYGGFHGYDIDFSLQVNTKYDVFVIFDIL